MLCAKHPCRSFQRKQQKNVDFAFLKALKSTNVELEQGMLLIYDIACQYFIHFHDHISPEIPFKLQVEAAIGLFHVYAHKDKCFFRYATSFIPGASVIAAEILESLWSSLNSISPTARTATLAHWAEMLDDHVLQFFGLYFALFTYVFSLFLEVSHGAAALTHFSLTHIAATLLTHSAATLV